MATWTSADVTNLKAAIAQGILTVTYDGPPKRSITYADLGAMRALLSSMQQDVNGTPNHRFAATSKGF